MGISGKLIHMVIHKSSLLTAITYPLFPRIYCILQLVMKLELLWENFGKALATVSKSISSKPQISIYSNVLIKATQDGISLESAGSEMGTTVQFGGKVVAAGEFTVPAKTLIELVSSLGPGKLELEKVEGQLIIKSGQFKAKINGISASEWPAKPVPADGERLEFETAEFLKAIPKVSFATAGDDGRPVLTGILFQSVQGGLNLVAADGFRLSLQVLPVANKLDGNFIVPARILSELTRLVTIGGKKIALIFGKSQLNCQVEDVYLWARLIEGNFPAYEKIIPTNQTVTVTVDRQVFLAAVRTAGIFGRDNSNIIKVKIEAGGVKVSGQSAQTGENETELPAKTEGLSGELTVAFNYRYLLDLFSIDGGEEVVIGLTDVLSAVTFRFFGDKTFFHLIMPVRITE